MVAFALKRAADTLAPIYQGEMQATSPYASSEALELPPSLGLLYPPAPLVPLLGSALLVDERAFKAALMLDRSSLAKCIQRGDVELGHRRSTRASLEQELVRLRRTVASPSKWSVPGSNR